MSAEFFVSPEGNDNAAGSAADPFRSPAKADQALIASGGGCAWFAPGRYELPATWEIGPAAGGTRSFRALEPGTAFIDGGCVISGWREQEVHGCRAWVVDLPEVASGHWFFRQLFVNGRRAPRARLPKFGLEVGQRDQLFRMEEIRVLDLTSKMAGGDFQFRPSPNDVKNWPSLYDAEIVVPHFWLEERMGHLRLRPDGWLESARRSAFALTAAFGPELASYYIENLFEALSEPGEWYLDRHAGKLFYLPLADEDIRTTCIIAPRLKSLLAIRGAGYNDTKQLGDPCMDQLVGGVSFHGLVFQHADWVQPIPSFASHDKVPPPERPLAACSQSACDAPAAISLALAQDIGFLDCSVCHVGGYGMGIEQGCRRISVEGCTFSDLGAGGIRINGAERDGAPWRVTGYCSITDNTIAEGGRVFHAGVGILAMNTLENVIAHNEIRDLFYSGISIGWSWGYKDTISRDNLILFNVVEDVGQGLLSDLGAIYVLGVQPGTVVRGNRIKNVLRRHYGSSGIYLDEGASHIVVEENFVAGVQGACANVHFGRENIFRHNCFRVTPGGVGLTIGKTENHVAANFFANTMVFEANGAAFGGGYKGNPRRSFLSLGNVYLTPDGQPPVLWEDGHGERVFFWQEWEQAGQDSGSVIQKGAQAETGSAAWNFAGPRARENRTRLAQPMSREDRPAA